jgi:hypothetical protein
MNTSAVAHHNAQWGRYRTNGRWTLAIPKFNVKPLPRYTPPYWEPDEEKSPHQREIQALPSKCQARIVMLASLDASRGLWRATNWQRILRGTSASPQDLEGIRAASYHRRSCPLGADVMVHLRLWPCAVAALQQ